MPWPRIQFHELGDQPWCPAWLHHHEQFSLSQLWNLRVPLWSRGSLATAACTVLKEHLGNNGNLSSYTIVDVCAGAGGPTPFIERELNGKSEKEGNEPVTFMLTDMFPPVDVWSAIAKKQPNIEFIEESVDARAVGRIAERNKNECRVFNICFHHFDDDDAAGILGGAVEEADAFVIFEITARQVSTCLYSPLVFFWGFYVSLLWYWSSPVHLFFTFILPIAPLALWVDGFISCLRTRTPDEIRNLLKTSGKDLNGWTFTSGEKSVQWPFITLYYFVGAGLGGLTCATACRRFNPTAHVVVLERAPQAREVGAGIQIPPNGTTVLKQLDLLPKILEKGSVVQHVAFRRYDTGRVLRSMPFGEDITHEFGVPWVIIHRQDFHEVLLDEAVRLGVEIRLNAEVTDVIFETPEVLLADGERVAGDVIIGADGLHSPLRSKVLDTPTHPIETGDLAYRAIIPRSRIEGLRDDEVNALCAETGITSWLGPDKHTIFYPVRQGEEFNLVLLRPDNLGTGVRRVVGDAEEMREAYREWDGRLTKLLSCVSEVTTWKLMHLSELERWTRGPVALLGDACHPTLPYQAQGAAMAVEDGFALGKLLALLQSQLDTVSTDEAPLSLQSRNYIPEVLKIYEKIRKARTARTVQAAINNRRVFHISDGIIQTIRDFALGYASVTWKNDWTWGLFSGRMREMLVHDLAGDCEREFDRFIESLGEACLIDKIAELHGPVHS
ncbi:hypothetical protein BDW74DRAFT_184446 [Aspergillus multicolor]|uniref:putative salicylate hydroxylase n=1 Tax=Aspergillus multicolor TaxID=41759 RepID=UPI003CCDB6A0